MQSRFENLLPDSGVTYYAGRIFSAEESEALFSRLLLLPWKNDVLTIYGRRIECARKTAWFGSKPYAYTYSHSTKIALPWTQELRAVKQRVEDAAGEWFNSCLANYYESGRVGMAWHSDDEETLDPGASIASVSFGAERPFYFRDTKSSKVEVLLEDGSLLVMDADSQRSWQHSLPVRRRIGGPRINLTFRRMKDDEELTRRM